MKIYNVSGQVVKTLANSIQRTGAYSVTWDGRDESGQKLAGGVYVYRLQAGGYATTNKLVLLR